MNTNDKFFQKCIKKIQNKALICRPNHELSSTKNGTFYAWISVSFSNNTYLFDFVGVFYFVNSSTNMLPKGVQLFFSLLIRIKSKISKGGISNLFFYALNATLHPPSTLNRGPLMNNTWMIYIHYDQYTILICLIKMAHELYITYFTKLPDHG